MENNSDDDIFRRTCKKCGHQFKSINKYLAHINDRKIPCDFKCEYCSKQCGCRRSFQRHIKKCVMIPDQEETNIKKHSTEVTDNSNNINTNTTNIAGDVNTSNQAIMMNPFGLEHMYMKYEKEFGHLRPRYRELIRRHSFLEVFNMIYSTVHGDPNKPENHNHYLESIDDEEIKVFSGKRFKMETVDNFSGKMLKFLRFEMKWLARSDDTFTDEEKSQFCWDVEANKMSDIDDKRMLKLMILGNKDVLENTLRNKDIYPNKDVMAKFKEVEPERIKTSGFPIKIDFLPNININDQDDTNTCS